MAFFLTKGKTNIKKTMPEKSDNICIFQKIFMVFINGFALMESIQNPP